MTHVQADVRRCRRELSSLYTTDVAALLLNNRYISNIVCAWNKCVLYNLHTCGYITVNTQVQGRFFRFQPSQDVCTVKLIITNSRLNKKVSLITRPLTVYTRCIWCSNPCSLRCRCSKDWLVHTSVTEYCVAQNDTISPVFTKVFRFRIKIRLKFLNE